MSVQMPEPKGTALGKETTYSVEYDPSLLFAIPRSLGREAIGMTSCYGVDVWRVYELTWLDSMGFPHYGAGEIWIPASSFSIVESKSLKLYFNSFTQSKFGSIEEVNQTISKDLSCLLQAEVVVKIEELSQWDKPVLTPQYQLLEDVVRPFAAKYFDVEPKLLFIKNAAPALQEWSTNLFRSCCPVTGQPDHATVTIQMMGPEIDPQSLLQYLVSYRCHRGFHEQCCEQIMMDLIKYAGQQHVRILCAFTRRGGIDINPYRATDELLPETIDRMMRQ